MKNMLIICTILVSSGFTVPRENRVGGGNWWMCDNKDCCRTKSADQCPWENGCRGSSSGMHHYVFLGKAGDFNHTCRKCDAMVFLTSGSSPAASSCCAGNTHSWYHK
jgi:hypothetical protein